MERTGNMTYTYIEESPYQPGKWLIYFKNCFMPEDKIIGCLHVFGARLFGLTYANYLRYLRDKCGAEIQGKNSRYPTPYFLSERECQKVADELDRRIKLIVNEKSRYME